MRKIPVAALVAAVVFAVSGCGGVDRPEDVAWLPQPRDFSAGISACEELVFAREVRAARNVIQPSYSECWVIDDGWDFLAEDATRLAEELESRSGGVIVGEPLGGAEQRRYCRPALLAEAPRRVDGYIAGFFCRVSVDYRGDDFVPLNASVTAWVLLNDTQVARLREVAGDLASGLDAPQRMNAEAVELLRTAPVELAVFVRERGQ